MTPTGIITTIDKNIGHRVDEIVPVPASPSAPAYLKGKPFSQLWKYSMSGSAAATKDILANICAL